MPEMPDELILMNSAKKNDYSAFLVSKEDYGEAGVGFKFHIITEDGQGMNALVPKDRLMPLYAFLKHHLGV